MKEREKNSGYQSIRRIAYEVQNKLITPDHAAYEALAKIKKFNSVINCVVSWNDSFVDEQVAQLKAKLEEGIKLPLAGVPVLVKDNICTKDYPTTASSKMLEGYRSPYDAFAVERLRESGCIIIGKANCDEFAMGNSNENSYFGPVANPWNIEKVSGGSSGGSAAAVAANIVSISLGSDTGGSVRQPASLCGVVGLKPTYGLVSRRGLIAYASSLDQIGPIGRSVDDVELALKIIEGYDPLDSTSKNPAEKRQHLEDKKRHKKVGLIREFLEEGVDDDVRHAVKNQVESIKQMGFDVDLVSIPQLKYALASYYIIATAEASANLARYDGVRFGYRANMASKSSENLAPKLEDLYKQSRSEGFSQEVKKRIMLGTFVLSHGYFDAYYNTARRARKEIRQRFLQLFTKFDFLIGPTSPETAFDKGRVANDALSAYLLDICTISANLAGLPAISIPVEVDRSKLPIGLQIIASPFDEPGLISFSKEIEKKADFNSRYSATSYQGNIENVHE